MRDYKKYTVWNEGHRLVLEIYKITNSFPKDELFGLSSQIRRAMVSVPTNIAEGCGRETDKDFKRFLVIAHGSATEVEYLLFLSNELNFVTNKEYLELNERIIILRKQLHKLIIKIKANS